MSKLCEVCSRKCSPQQEEDCLKAPRLNLGAGHMILKDHINYDQMAYEGGKIKADIICSLDELAEAGLGSDWINGCFVCGYLTKRLHTNISAYVKTKEDEEEIESWFTKGGVLLDYRESEPNWIQVKIGCCPDHQAELVELNNKTLTYGIIRKCFVDDILNKGPKNENNNQASA